MHVAELKIARWFIMFLKFNDILPIYYLPVKSNILVIYMLRTTGVETNVCRDCKIPLPSVSSISAKSKFVIK